MQVSGRGTGIDKIGGIGRLIGDRSGAGGRVVGGNGIFLYGGVAVETGYSTAALDIADVYITAGHCSVLFVNTVDNSRSTSGVLNIINRDIVDKGIGVSSDAAGL